MDTRNIIIKENQFLGDKFSLLPSNSIIRKNITGIGATTLEIQSQRNSIIVLPNLPVIYQKALKHDGVLGVHGDTTILEIINYLSDTRLPFKKILITPESFHKMITAFENQKINFRNDYFLLFDECDKICKDINYRQAITLPMTYFFGFANKAFISATAMIPSDPRFEQQNFQLINVEPDYQIKTRIKLYKTNNACYTFEYLIGKNLRNRTYFIFCNSVNLITHIINKKGIGSDSSIFCGETSADRIKSRTFKHVGSKLDESKFSTYNFLTSRFYSALDIDFDKDVEIFIISDLGISEYTIIDPKTDTIQIIGRFRNKKIKKNVSIIATEDPDLISLSRETCYKIIETNKSTYDTIRTFAETLPSGETQEILRELNNLLDYNRFIYKNGSLNYFAVDNYIYKHDLTGLYKDFSKLKELYGNLRIDNTTIYFFEIEEFSEINAKIPSSSEKLLLIKGKKFTTIVHEIINILDSLKKTNQLDITPFEEVKSDLKKAHYEIVKAYELLDPEVLKLVANPNELKKELYKVINSKVPTNFPFLRDLQSEFIIGEKLELIDIEQKFKECIDKHKLEIKPKLKELQKYIQLKRCKINKSNWGYRVADYINLNN